MAAHDQVEVPGLGAQDRIGNVTGRVLRITDVRQGDHQVAALIDLQEVRILLL